MSIINDSAAIAELSGLSLNAKRYLMDRIGNNLNAITLSNSLGRVGQVQEAADMLIGDLQKIGLFEMRTIHRPETGR